MRLYTPSKWDYSDPQLDGILFFTQRIDEMLHDFTITKYRAPVLNTHLLIVEYLQVYRGEKVAHYNLPSILDEIKYSLQKDPILKKYLGSEYIESTYHSLCTLSDERKIILLDLMDSTWGSSKYLSWCIQYAKDVIKEPKNKEKIDLMLRCLIPELIGYGYSSSFIYNYNHEYFSSRKNSNYDKACIFLDRFDGVQRKYTVYMACDKQIEAFRSALGSRLDINFEEDENCNSFKHNPDQIVVYIKDIDALDYNGAALYAFKTLNIFLRFYSAISNKKPLCFSTKSMVFQKDHNKPAFVTFQPNGFSAIQDIEDHQVPEFTIAVINGIFQNGPHSYNHLKRVLDLHNTSLSTSDYNGSFLNLWSILEVLSLSHDDKVNSVIEVLVPLLRKDWIVNSKSDRFYKVRNLLNSAGDKYPSVPCKRMLLNQ